jgi:flagellar assembly protein FliH
VEAYEKGLKAVNQDCDRLLCEIQAGLELFREEKKALEEKHLEGMKELSLAVAEKVIGMNLESQSDVIRQMIVSSLDNSKATQWIKIHISGFDAERYFEIEQELLESVRHISDFVKVEVVEGAERGTCIIEMPDKIIDASINTQLGNIRNMLEN